MPQPPQQIPTEQSGSIWDNFIQQYIQSPINGVGSALGGIESFLAMLFGSADNNNFVLDPFEFSGSPDFSSRDNIPMQTGAMLGTAIRKFIQDRQKNKNIPGVVPGGTKTPGWGQWPDESTRRPPFQQPESRPQQPKPWPDESERRRVPQQLVPPEALPFGPLPPSGSLGPLPQQPPSPNQLPNNIITPSTPGVQIGPPRPLRSSMNFQHDMPWYFQRG